MKKIISSLIFMITITVNLNAKSKSSCLDYCLQQNFHLYQAAAQNKAVCVQGCDQDSYQPDWLDQIECMIRGDCEEKEKEGEDFLEYCKMACDVEFQACLEYIYGQVDACMANCT